MAEPRVEPQSTDEKLVTADELLAMPDDGRRRELIRGRLVDMPPGGEEHGLVECNILFALRLWCDAHQAGRVYTSDIGIHIERDPDTVRAPDTAFISAARLAGPPSKRFASVVPDLIVEVVSPNDTKREVGERAAEWLEASASVVWVVWPQHRRITIYRPHGNIHTLEGDAVLTEPDLLPGFELPLNDVFV